MHTRKRQGKHEKQKCSCGRCVCSLETDEAGAVDITALPANGMNHPAPEQHMLFCDALFDIIFH